jgi:hypothetical protein
MRHRRGWAPHNTPARQAVSSKSWATAKADNDAPPEWLRRSYTRTVSKDLRTVEQLRLSFEDVRRQWRSACDQYTSSESTTTAVVAPCGSHKPLQPDLRRKVDQLVGQLKSVKQELLAQLTRLLNTLSVSDDLPAAAGFVASSPGKQEKCSPDERWLSGLLGGRGAAVDHLHLCTSQQEYLSAVWLARRVWVWSVCLACATMDLELLSGSVSFSAQLFCGCPFAEPTEGCDEAAHLQGFVLHSCYDHSGEITEQVLRSAVASATAAAAAVPVTGAASAEAPRENEACEMRAFFGCVCGSPFTAATRLDSRTSGVCHFDPGAALVGAAASPPLRPIVGDAFWVHAIALCYSAVTRDDTGAARLLTFFADAYSAFFETNEDEEEDVVAFEGPPPRGVDESGERLRRCIAFLLQVVTLLLDEDYPALQQLWQREGYLSSGRCGVEKPDVATAANMTNVTVPACDSDSAPLVVMCPEASLMVLLVRLLGEHVVRRRWTEQQVGQAFRPVEPVPHPELARKESSDVNPNRLVCALLQTSQRGLAHPSGLEAENSSGGCRHAMAAMEGTAAMQFCHALQLTALREMGGDWPLPGTLLRAAF